MLLTSARNNSDGSATDVSQAEKVGYAKDSAHADCVGFAKDSVHVSLQLFRASLNYFQNHFASCEVLAESFDRNHLVNACEGYGTCIAFQIYLESFHPEHVVVVIRIRIEFLSFVAHKLAFIVSYGAHKAMKCSTAVLSVYHDT